MQISILSIIIPVFNEEKTVAEVLDRVLKVELVNGIRKEVVLVNDASNDQSKKVIEGFLNKTGSQDRIKFISHHVNQGKGGSIQTALQHISGEYFVIQDADLELDPNDYNLLLHPVISGKANVVYGSRFLNKGQSRSLSLSLLANKFLTRFSNIAFGVSLTDMETCYKLIPAHALKTIQLVEKRFGFEPEITAKLARNKALTFAEVPVRYFPRTGVQGKKIGWVDGVRAVWCILKYGSFLR